MWIFAGLETVIFVLISLNQLLRFHLGYSGPVKYSQGFPESKDHLYSVRSSSLFFLKSNAQQRPTWANDATINKKFFPSAFTIPFIKDMGLTESKTEWEEQLRSHILFKSSKKLPSCTVFFFAGQWARVQVSHLITKSWTKTSMQLFRANKTLKLRVRGRQTGIQVLFKPCCSLSFTFQSLILHLWHWLVPGRLLSFVGGHGTVAGDYMITTSRRRGRREG